MEEPQRRRLTKGHDRMIGGVASGFAEYLDVDATIVRVAFVLAGLVAPPPTVFAYLLFLVILPSPGAAPDGAAAAPTRDGVALIGLVLLGIGAFMLLGGLWSGMWSWGMPGLWGGSGWFWPLRLVWPLLILLAGVFLLTRARR